MVNENQGKVYEPIAHYNRKLIRSVLRNRTIEKNGYHRVSKFVHDGFEEIKNMRKASNEE